MIETKLNFSGEAMLTSEFLVVEEATFTWFTSITWDMVLKHNKKLKIMHSDNNLLIRREIYI